MQPIKKNRVISIPAVLLLLFCWAMISSASATQVPPSSSCLAHRDHSSQPFDDMSKTHPVEPQNAPLRFLMVADNAGTEETVNDEEIDMEARRQQMIEYCEANRGTDCERKVDIELEAQQDGGTAVYDNPDRTHRPIRPRPRPRASP